MSMLAYIARSHSSIQFLPNVVWDGYFRQNWYTVIVENYAYVYMVQCADGTFYTGYAADVEQRLRAHNSGKGAKYTRGRLPVKLVYVERAANRSEALRRESAIKKLRRREKETLCGRGGITPGGATPWTPA